MTKSIHIGQLMLQRVHSLLGNGCDMDKAMFGTRRMKLPLRVISSGRKISTFLRRQGWEDSQWNFVITEAGVRATIRRQILKLVDDAPNKHCTLDPAPTWLVELHSPTYNIYLSCYKEITDRLLRDAITENDVCHLLLKKTKGLDKCDLKNHRHMSFFTFLSIVLERVVSQQLTEFLETSNALPKNCLKCKVLIEKQHSTESALLWTFSDVCKAISDGNVCLLGCPDLSSSFEMVDHNILLKRLEILFGVNGSALEWLQS